MQLIHYLDGKGRHKLGKKEKSFSFEKIEIRDHEQTLSAANKISKKKRLKALKQKKTKSAFRALARLLSTCACTLWLSETFKRVVNQFLTNN